MIPQSHMCYRMSQKRAWQIHVYKYMNTRGVSHQDAWPFELTNPVLRMTNGHGLSYNDIGFTGTRDRLNAYGSQYLRTANSFFLARLMSFRAQYLGIDKEKEWMIHNGWSRFSDIL